MGADGPRAGPPGHRPTWVEVDLGAIAHNVVALRRVAGTPHLLAAVKANAYGHGLVEVAATAHGAGADWLGVAMIEEAEALRAADVTCPLLLLSEPPPDAIAALLHACVTPVVYSEAFIDALDRHARRHVEGPLSVHLKLDTGMHRVGTPPSARPAVLARLARARGLRVDGVMTHLAEADDASSPATSAQLAAFSAALHEVREAGLEPRIVHAANSAASVRGLARGTDLARPGISVYGLDPAGPSAEVAGHVGLRPALTWWTRVSYVKQVEPGASVGYGGTWTATRPTTVATVPVGYGDGLPRAAARHGQMVVGGRRAPLVGRVSMDQTTLAVPAGTRMGDDVAIIGRLGDDEVTAQDWSAWLSTISYEVTTAISARVPRVHLPWHADAAPEAGG